MKYIILIIAFFIQIHFCARLFLMGGAISANNTQVFSALAKSTSKIPLPNKCNQDWVQTTCPKIAVVTSAAATQADGNDAYNTDYAGSPSYHTMFFNYGLAPRHVSAHIDNYQNATNNATATGLLNQNILLQADIVFFNGGDQSRHSRTWLNDNGTCNLMFCKLIDRYNKGQVIFAGTSAGTMVLSKITYGQGSSYGQWYFTNKVGLAQKSVSDGKVNGTGLADTRNGTSSSSLQYTQNGGKMPGFDCMGSDYLFDTHFAARGRLSRVVPALKDMKLKYAIGVDQNSALFIDGSNAVAYGENGVYIIDASSAVYPTGQFFIATNIRLHYLTSNDQFNFSSFNLISSKPQITNPYYSGTTNSNNITQSYQSTLLLTRLVDQKGDMNVGKSTTPSYFAKSTPMFSMNFNKDSLTKGYFGNKKYSVYNALLSYSFGSNDIQVDQLTENQYLRKQ